MTQRQGWRSSEQTRYWRRAPELDILEYVCSKNRRPTDEGFDPPVSR